MRLYVNTKEVPLLKDALVLALQTSLAPSERGRLSDLLKRVKLCEELQESERRAKNKEGTQDEM